MTSANNFDQQVEKNYKHNYRVNFLDGTFFWFGTSFIAAQTILPAFISNITINPIIIGMVSAIWASGWYLPQLFTSNWVQSLSLKKIVPVKYGFFTERVPLLLLPLSAWIFIKSPTAALILFLILYSWHSIGAGFIAVAWQDMIAKIIPLKRRGRFFGITNFGGTFAGIIGAFYSVKIIKNFVFPYNYMICFSIAGLAVLISWVFLSKTKEVEEENIKPRPNNHDYRGLIFKIFKKDKNFTSFILYRVVSLIGAVGLGFVAIYAKISLHVTDNMIASFTISMLVGQAISNLLFGWLSDKKGHKICLEISNFSGFLVLIITLLTTNPIWLYVSFFFMGAYIAGNILSGIAIIFEFSDPDIRPTYIGIASTSGGIVTALTPIFAGWIAKGFGYPPLFVGATLLWVVGFLMLKSVVQEPRGMKNTILE